ncbi:MAG: CCA tRNA nucleotidyltransferase [Clostridia bacterium]
MKCPREVQLIFSELRKHGHQGWVVGGAIRDFYNGNKPDDYDIATTALPEEIEEIFERTIPTGKEHGTITVLVSSKVIEVTTLRVEKEYSDYRHPDQVEFTSNIVKDLERRDFTINAMAYNDIDGLIDPFEGKNDLDKKVVRSVGCAKERFLEDPLRMLRAVRFAVTLGFEIEESTYKAIEELSSMLRHISNDRIGQEMVKLFSCQKPSKGIQIIVDTGLVNKIIPELIPMINFEQNNPHHDLDVYKHSLCVIDSTRKEIILKLAALFHDIAKPKTYVEKDGIGHFYGHEEESANMAINIMDRWRINKASQDKVAELINRHLRLPNPENKFKVKKFISEVGLDTIDLLSELMIADRVCKSPPYDFEEIYRLKFVINEILKEEEPLKVTDLKVNGNDMIEIGYKGKSIGEVLNSLLTIVLDHPRLNDKEYLMQKATEWHEKSKNSKKK